MLAAASLSYKVRVSKGGWSFDYFHHWFSSDRVLHKGMRALSHPHEQLWFSRLDVRRTCDYARGTMGT